MQGGDQIFLITQKPFPENASTGDMAIDSKKKKKRREERPAKVLRSRCTRDVKTSQALGDMFVDRVDRTAHRPGRPCVSVGDWPASPRPERAVGRRLNMSYLRCDTDGRVGRADGLAAHLAPRRPPSRRGASNKCPTQCRSPSLVTRDFFESSCRIIYRERVFKIRRKD